MGATLRARNHHCTGSWFCPLHSSAMYSVWQTVPGRWTGPVRRSGGGYGTWPTGIYRAPPSIVSHPSPATSANC